MLRLGILKIFNSCCLSIPANQIRKLGETVITYLGVTVSSASGVWSKVHFAKGFVFLQFAFISTYLGQ